MRFGLKMWSIGCMSGGLRDMCVRSALTKVATKSPGDLEIEDS
jgi:hypothetical protein